MTQKEETFPKPAAPSGDGGGGGGGTSSHGLAIGSFPSHQQPPSQQLQQQQQPPSLLTPHQEHPLESVANQTTYMFTGHDPLAPPVGTTAPSTSRILLDGYPRSAASSGHSRSISHGEGGSFGGPIGIGAGALGGVGGHAGRPSALKSAVKGGHQRALSQGQIMDTPTHATGRGHSRVGSKTDFILPPGHKEPTESRERDAASQHHLGVPHSATSTTSKGHSRQASRSESIYTLRRANKPPWWKRFWFCRLRSTAGKLEDRGYRIVVPNHTVPPKTPKRDHPNGRLCGNKIRTTKYTLLSFVPKNLLEQFHRIANLYFIFIVLLNWFPQINAFGKEIAMIPVLFVLGVTAIKDLFEDRRRKASDKRINNSTCRVYNG